MLFDLHYKYNKDILNKKNPEYRNTPGSLTTIKHKVTFLLSGSIVSLALSDRKYWE
jgi:hypothetical protein